MKDGFSFQAGAGGTALAFAIYLKEMMVEAGVKAGFVRGGSTKYLVEMLEEGLTPVILDGQTFDLEGVRSMRENPGHQNTSPFTSYNFHGKGNFASMVDVVILGATEVDTDFNANVVTHTDGSLLHGRDQQLEAAVERGLVTGADRQSPCPWVGLEADVVQKLVGDVPPVVGEDVLVLVDLVGHERLLTDVAFGDEPIGTTKIGRVELTLGNGPIRNQHLDKSELVGEDQYVRTSGAQLGDGCDFGVGLWVPHDHQRRDVQRRHDTQGREVFGELE